MRKINSWNFLGPPISAFVVDPEEQISGSPFELLPSGDCRNQHPNKICFISTTAWDRIFDCCSNDIPKYWWARFTSGNSVGNKILACLLVNALQWLHLALRNFHRLIGLLGTGRASLGGTISEGRCCDLGNFSKICLSGTRLSEPTLKNVRSGLVPVFQRPE